VLAAPAAILSQYLPAGTLIAVVLAVIALEMLGLAVGLVRGRALAKAMLPGAAAGLFLTLALLDLHTGAGWLALWLAGAGAAHGWDWWRRLRP
jgi:hypothetical protein